MSNGVLSFFCIRWYQKGLQAYASFTNIYVIVTSAEEEERHIMFVQRCLGCLEKTWVTLLKMNF